LLPSSLLSKRTTTRFEGVFASRSTITPVLWLYRDELRSTVSTRRPTVNYTQTGEKLLLSKSSKISGIDDFDFFEKRFQLGKCTSLHSAWLHLTEHEKVMTEQYHVCVMFGQVWVPISTQFRSTEIRLDPHTRQNMTQTWQPNGQVFVMFFSWLIFLCEFFTLCHDVSGSRFNPRWQNITMFWRS